MTFFGALPRWRSMRQMKLPPLPSFRLWVPLARLVFFGGPLALPACHPHPAAPPAASRPAEGTGVPASPAQQNAALSDPLNFAVIGDFGEDGVGEAAVAALVDSWHPDFVITTGDNNYPGGAAATFEANIAKHYAPYIAFGPAYSGPSKARAAAAGATRFFPALGNHDWRVPGARDHLALFSLPGNGRYFAVSKGAVDFFFVDSDRREPDGTSADSKQGRWLQQALADSHAKAKVVVFHHPPYTVGSHPNAEYMRWPFAQWGASLVLSGHNHDYERHTVDGIPFIINGIGGARLHDLKGACTMAESSRDVCFSPGFGAMRARTTGASPSKADFLLVEGMDTNHAVFDRFTLPL